MRTIYVADDGSIFDDEYECKDYEWELDHPHLKDVSVYDVVGVKETINSVGEWVFDDHDASFVIKD